MKFEKVLDMVGKCTLDQLMCYVTVWTIENEVLIDTNEYDEKINELYNKCIETGFISGFSLKRFDHFICKYLV